MRNAAIKVTETTVDSVVALMINHVLRSLDTDGVWTRGALARNAADRPLESREAIRQDAVRFSLLGAIEYHVPYTMHRAVIGAITHVCQERHLASNLTRVNETVSLSVIVEVLREAVRHVRTDMREQEREVIEFVALPSGTPTAEDLQAQILQLRELEQEAGTLWADYTCGENITPSLLRVATLRKEMLRSFLACSYSDLMLLATADQMEAATRALA